MPNLTLLARAERADLLELLQGLTPQQWEAPSLCAGWRVRDVVAHLLSYEELDTPELARRLARGRLRLSRSNAVGLAECADRTPQQLLDLLGAHLTPRGLTAGFGCRIALTDGTIHHQDIRRPLGIPRVVPTDRLTHALDFARWAPPVGAFRRVRGLRLRATDLDWSTGRGPEVSGPGEALLLAMAGRPGITSELAGEGRPLLARRIGE